MGIERKWRELHNQSVNCYESISIHLWNEKCDLCLCEKLLIPRVNSACLLNKRDELVSKCCHMNKFTLNVYVRFVLCISNCCRPSDDWVTPMKDSVMVYCCC